MNGQDRPFASRHLAASCQQHQQHLQYKLDCLAHLSHYSTYFTALGCTANTPSFTCHLRNSTVSFVRMGTASFSSELLDWRGNADPPAHPSKQAANGRMVTISCMWAARVDAAHAYDLALQGSALCLRAVSAERTTPVRSLVPGAAPCCSCFGGTPMPLVRADGRGGAIPLARLLAGPLDVVDLGGTASFIAGAGGFGIA
jgi:hypothetical protein